MCGIAGFWPIDLAIDQARETLQIMARELAHRGPDDEGFWIDPETGLAITHRRLSIVDLSANGHQPMTSASGRWVIVCNGEIYNHSRLRQDLEDKGLAPKWRGHSDIETLLACFDAWGVEGALEKCVGMYAFGVCDRENRELILARDRIGEKPIYYGWQNGTFLFGSELKSLRSHPSFAAQIDRDALTLLLRYNCIPAPHCIYKGISKLMPGHILRVPLYSKDRGSGANRRRGCPCQWRG